VPQPTFLKSGGIYVAHFGNQFLPNGQGVLSNINLNDRVNTFAFFGTGLVTEDDNVQRGFAQVPYLGKGLWTYDDFGQRVISIPSYYLEDSTHFLGQFLAALSQAGEQQLTFDNLTYIPVKYAGTSGRKEDLGKKGAWFFNLNFVARQPWFSDIAATTATPWNPLTVDLGVNVNITYAGSVWAEPVWTLNIPAQPQNVTSFQLRNQMSKEFLTVNFQSGYPGGIPAGHTVPVTIDCAAMTASGVIIALPAYSFDVTGSFPMLYGPTGQVQTFLPIITMASGSSTGTITLAYSVQNRWQI